MKKIFVQYAAYHVWASQRIADVILQLSDEQVRQEINSSFNSIYATLIHMWDAESAWWQRSRLQENIALPGAAFNGNVELLLKKMMEQSVLWKNWVDQATEAALEHEFIYRNNKKEQFKQPVYEVLLHLYNHQTYHRGQIITMLRQMGVDKIPGTDLIIFLRKK